jgi:hypothetical protein
MPGKIRLAGGDLLVDFRVAHLREVGRKFGHWLNLVFLQRVL